MLFVATGVVLLAARADWPHWRDVDRDGDSTRYEVLERDSLSPPLWARGKIAGGLWACPFTGKWFMEPSGLDVDHLIPLNYMERNCGGLGWDRTRRTLYANELDDSWHLLAVDASANRSKGARGPSQWLPPLKASHCSYVAAWKRIGLRWGCKFPVADQLVIDETLVGCKVPKL